MRLDYIDCCDCLEGMKQIPDGSVDMILCDLPYGTTVCKWDAVIPFEPMWGQYKRIIKDNGAVVLFASEPFSSKLIQSNVEQFKYKWIWKKEQGTNPLVAKKQPLNDVEEICVFYRKQATYNPQFEKGRPYKRTRDKKERVCEAYRNVFLETRTENCGTRYPKRILAFKREKGLHTAQKPVPLLEYLIKTYTNPGEVVLDNCIGSGSTAEACIRTGRHFIGFELDPKYHKIAVDRVEAARKEMEEL